MKLFFLVVIIWIAIMHFIDWKRGFSDFPDDFEPDKIIINPFNKDWGKI